MAPVRSASRHDRVRSTRGAELIEFALVLPVLLVILGAILDMGFAFNNYLAVANAAREGARLASIPGWADDDVKTRVRTYLAGAGLVAERANTTIAPDPLTISGRTIKAYQVQVSYPYDYMILGPLLTLVGGTSSSGLSLRAAATMRTELAAGL